MFLLLTHTKFDVYRISGNLLLECYKLMALLPKEEKFNLVSQIKRSALSVKLNIAEGCSRKTVADRKRFYEIARGSVVELDAAIEACFELKLLSEEEVNPVGELLNRTYAMLSKMISK
jgi:four helix bundle protein